MLKFDYGVGGVARFYPPSHQTSANSRGWKCARGDVATQKAAIRMDRRVQRRRGRERVEGWRLHEMRLNARRTTRASNFEEKTSARKMFEDFIVVGTSKNKEMFKVDLVKETQTGANLCGKGWAGVYVPSCYQLCCYTVYAKTSFCKSKKSCF